MAESDVVTAGWGARWFPGHRRIMRDAESAADEWMGLLDDAGADEVPVSERREGRRQPTADDTLASFLSRATEHAGPADRRGLEMLLADYLDRLEALGSDASEVSRQQQALLKRLSELNVISIEEVGTEAAEALRQPRISGT